jgi:hypothetical protein
MDGPLSHLSVLCTSAFLRETSFVNGCGVLSLRDGHHANFSCSISAVDKMRFCFFTTKDAKNHEDFLSRITPNFREISCGRVEIQDAETEPHFYHIYETQNNLSSQSRVPAKTTSLIPFSGLEIRSMRLIFRGGYCY